MTGTSQNGSQPIKPLFSVIILCWNSDRYLRACLDALDKQTCKDFEIILVDNGSPEPVSTASFVNFPTLPIRLFKLDHNLGFAGGNNSAASQARGDYLALLNADAFPTPGWLEAISKAIPNYPVSFFASKLIMANQPDRLDGVGDIYHASGLAWRSAYNYPLSMVADLEKEVFSACAAAAVYPKDAYNRAYGFDPDYFSYVEDVDLGFRLRLLGYKCIYLPDANVRHVGSGSTGKRSDLSVYHGTRNLIWTFYKDMPGFLVVALTPLHLLAEFMLLMLGVIRKQGLITLKAQWDAFASLPVIFKKRKTIQSSRKVSIFTIMKSIDWDPFSPLTKLLHNDHD